LHPPRNLLLGVGIVLDPGAHSHECTPRRDLGGGDIYAAPELHVEAVHHSQPHVSVNPLTRVPAGGVAVAVVVAYGNEIVASSDKVRDVPVGVQVAVGMASDFLAVDPDMGRDKDPLKVQIYAFAHEILGDGQALAVPADSSRPKAVVTRPVEFVFDERSVDAGVVRQMDGLPGTVVVADLFGAGLLVVGEAPVEVDAYAFPCVRGTGRAKNNPKHQ